MLRYISSANGLHTVQDTESLETSVFSNLELSAALKESGSIAGLFFDADENIWSVFGTKIVDVSDLRVAEESVSIDVKASIEDTIVVEEPVPVEEYAPFDGPVSVEEPAPAEEFVPVEEQVVETTSAPIPEESVSVSEPVEDEATSEDFVDMTVEQEEPAMGGATAPKYQFRYCGVKNGLHRVEDLEDGVIDELTDIELRQALNAVGAIDGLIIYDDGSIWDDFGVLRVAGPKAPTKNSNLHRAKRAKNDEFYTQLVDIEKELSQYPEGTFKDKVIYCPTDVAVNTGSIMQSQFVKYFQMNAHRLQFKRLIATCLVEKAAGVGEDIEQVQNCYVLERSVVPMSQRTIWTWEHGYGSNSPATGEFLDEAGRIMYETPMGSHAVPYHIITQAVTDADGRVVYVKRYIDHYDEMDGHPVLCDEFKGVKWVLGGHELTIKWCRLHPDGVLEMLPNECYFVNKGDFYNDFSMFPKDVDGNPCFESVDGGSVCLYPPEYYNFQEGDYVGYSWHCPADDKWGSGDFRSEYCTKLLAESDVVVTNPPFSLFREFVRVLVMFEKKFIIVGNQNSITNKEFFPLIQSDSVWIGTQSGVNNDWYFECDKSYPVSENIRAAVEKKFTREFLALHNMIKMPGACWFTNIDISKRHEYYVGLSREEYERNGVVYRLYDNYNAINVDRSDQVPMDYTGIMGVPLTFIYRYNPDQFEIIWQASGNTRASATDEVLKELGYVQSSDDRGGAALLDGKIMYTRLFIRRRDV